MESTAPTGFIIAGFLVGLVGVWLSAWLLPVAMLLFSIGIMWHVTEQRKLLGEDFADLRKRINRQSSGDQKSTDA